MVKMKSDNQYPIGSDKQQVIKEIGQECNFFRCHIWTYTLKIDC